MSEHVVPAHALAAGLMPDAISVGGVMTSTVGCPVDPHHVRIDGDAPLSSPAVA